MSWERTDSGSERIMYVTQTELDVDEPYYT